VEKKSFRPSTAGAALVLLIVGGAACEGPQRGDGRSIAVGTSICEEIRIVKAVGAVAEDHLAIIDGEGHPIVPLLPRELATIQTVLVSPAKDMALVVSVGEGHPWINVYRIADWFAPFASTADGVQPYRTMDPYPFSWSDIAWRSRAEVAFRSAGDYGRFDPATRRPGGEFDGPDKAWIWNVAADTIRPADARR
jgi:hypothetical protein